MKFMLHIAVIFAALLLVAADKKPQKVEPSPEQIQTWIKQLGNEDFKVREEATRNLLQTDKIARAAYEATKEEATRNRYQITRIYHAVYEATESEDAEVKQRALKIYKQIRKATNAYKTMTPIESLSFDQLVTVIQDDELGKDKPYRVKDVMLRLGKYHSSKAAPILVERLEFYVPSLVKSTEARYPAVKALKQIGYAALPTITDAVALKPRSDSFKYFAKGTIVRITGTPKEGYKYIQQRAEMYRKAAKRLEELLPEKTKAKYPIKVTN